MRTRGETMTKIKKILLWIWQLPQNLIGLIITRFANVSTVYHIAGQDFRVWFVPCLFRCGVSLGEYIIFDQRVYGRYDTTAYLTKIVNHEAGHTLQSRMLGPLYLLVVGLPSILLNNIWDRLFHKKWSYKDRYEWYYSRYPEKWADDLLEG